MLLTITCTPPDGAAWPATDLGFLLHKNPDRAQEFEQSYGTAHVVYPEATRQRCTALLLLEVDPIRLVRGRSRGTPDFSLGQYVNDRPYAASSLLSVAIGSVFRTALNGRCAQRPELVRTALPLTLELPAVPCKGGPEVAERVFAPLGWTVEATALPLDPAFPEWGDSHHLRLRLTGTMRLSEALSHLYVLLPVLDGAKHYWVAADEVDKLIRAGSGWLAAHPERGWITRRYLARRQALVQTALARLAEVDDTDPAVLDAVDETVDEDLAAGNDTVDHSGRSDANPADTGRTHRAETAIDVAMATETTTDAAEPRTAATALDTSAEVSDSRTDTAATSGPGVGADANDFLAATATAEADSAATILPAEPEMAGTAGATASGTEGIPSLAVTRRPETATASAEADASAMILPAGPEAAVAAESGVAQRTPSLAVTRRAAVVRALHEVGAQRVLDLGCGEGALLRELLADTGFREIVGVDVSVRALTVAKRRLRLDRLPPMVARRLTLRQGALTYTDARLRGYDAAVLMEVIEHVDPPRLGALEQAVFGAAAPGSVVVTTPNAEINVRFAGLAAGAFRHADHRFEWTRAEFAAWADRVAARYGYTVRRVAIGPEDPEFGPPTQMAVFTRSNPTDRPEKGAA